ncbi:PAS domain-containing protein [Aestuariispira ectoiniformans]|uniref:PAS domain-containing protein n=1 Tax=Aestuariispira ectoiniformans TaxID=2775080 RepID=UPI00223A7B01|nr:PAS domain-containing protein [Aestuariispira ectoiniformans]
MMPSRIEADIRDRIASRPLRQLLDHWFVARQDRLMPARADIDPTAIAPAIGHVWLMEAVPSESSFRYRLAGEDINMVYGFSLAGKLLEEVHAPDSLEGIRERLDRVVQGPCILYSHGRTRYRNGPESQHDRLVLPLSKDGRTVTDLIGVTKYAFGRDVRPGDLLHHVVDEVTVFPLT